MKEKREVVLECIFCSSTEFIIPYEGYVPHTNELIQCGNCGRINDFSAIFDLKINEIREQIANDFNKEIQKMFKKAFK